MHTEVIKVNSDNPDYQVIKKAAGYIREGKLVIIPTDTVYGLAASIENQHALERLYNLKKRPLTKPFTVCIANKAKVEELAVDIPPFAYRLMGHYWPGPLTIVFKSAQGISIGLRMPDNKIALDIIDLAEAGVALPSANISGRSAPSMIQDALADFQGEVELAIDAGPTELGVESTVVDVSKGDCQILREGAVSKEEILRLVALKRVLFVCTGNSCRSVMAHGLMEKIIRGQGRDDIEVLSAGISVLFGIGPTQETLDLLKEEGIDMSGYRSRPINEDMLKSADLILAMEDIHQKRILELFPQAKMRLYLLKEFARMSDNDTNIVDPIARGKEFYRDTFFKIKEAVQKVAGII